MTGGLLFAAAFLACAVEAVEATTVVLAVGVTRSWRSSLRGVLAGVVVLAVIVAALGPAISQIPLGPLRLVVGGLLLVFGLGWLRKAILRASGHKSLHDEASLYEKHLAEAREAGASSGRRGVMGPDAYAFTLSFKAVVLEGLEVAFIVVTFGANARQVPLAALAAIAAIAAVVALAIAVRAPLARVPENTIKFAVGVLLSSFGTFWGAEGAGAHWPANDGSLLWLIPVILVLALVLTRILRTVPKAAPAAPSPSVAAAATEPGTPIPAAPAPAPAPSGTWTAVRAGLVSFGLFWWDFVVGDDWSIAAAVLVGLGAVAGLADAGTAAWWALPALWALTLTGSLVRAVGLRRADRAGSLAA
ncbi:MAG TPA: hypothetical protein VFN60_10190 [Acidimicrobiales bacterium]|nr:hypothetical protein [Acidimicrobiales bacterium]